MTFLELFFAKAKTNAQKKVLYDDVSTNGITWNQLIDLSGRVYAYIKSKGLGREDFVLICLPRGIQPIIAEIGIWRAGAAFVIVEDTYAPDRIAFIRDDCGCKLTISSDNWDEIMRMEPLKGFAAVQPHDAALAVYTSGTTGNPKGVLHEFGNLDRIHASSNIKGDTPLLMDDEHFALVAPLNFVASIMVEILILSINGVLYITPYSTLKNPMALGPYLVKNNITAIFLTPSHLRKFDKKPPMLRTCFVGSEPANNIFVEGLTIHNFYAMSESGFAVAHFLIDKRYEFTPVGKSEFDHPIQLLDDTTGVPVAQGEEGEICFSNEYVRGYINLPDETAKAFKNGIYHTGDIGRFDENGNLIISGRLGDMVKVNGNRVEPGEIETVFRRVTNTTEVAARIFNDNKCVYICLYYTESIKLDEEKIRVDMMRFLPYYMIPSFFIHLSSLPLRPNGKLDRKALPAPDFSSFQNTYAGPRNEIETALCKGFAKTLDMGRIGIHDDFYQLGGDSLSSMTLISSCNLPGLKITDIYRGRTPEKIALLYLESLDKYDGKTITQIIEESIVKEHSLTVEQTYMVDYQLYTPKSTMYNLFSMLKLDKDAIDMERMTVAVNAAVRNHPALLTVFRFNDDGEIVQKYTPGIWLDAALEHVSEAELREQIIPTLVQPFKIIGSCLFRVRLFETEEAGYLFVDVHHTIFDGTSSKVFLNSILAAYAGTAMTDDGYYYMLRARENEVNSLDYKESHDYFNRRYDGIKWNKHPSTDKYTSENTDAALFVDLPITASQLENIQSAHSLSANAFFLCVTLLTDAIYDRRSDVATSWIFNGRNDAVGMTTVGLLFRNLFVGVQLHKETTLESLYADVVEQVNSGISHSCYPYVEKNSSVVDDDVVCVLYQDDLRNIENIPGLLGEVEVPHNKAASQNILDLEFLNGKDGMVLMLDYAASRYNPQSMKRFCKILKATVQSLLTNNSNAKVPLKNLLAEIIKAAGDECTSNTDGWLR